MSEKYLNMASALDLKHRLLSREIKSEDVVRDCLQRISLRDTRVRAWEYVPALSAVTANIDVRSGPLAGIPIAVKDVVDTSDMPTSYGSSLYADHRPTSDAAVVSSLRESGAIILGKTVSTEFAYLRPPRTLNPIDLMRTPGGSSSGSAAAVADNMVPLAIGTQTAGSTIRPAAFCGVVGFKPTYSAISMRGVRQLAESMDTIGLFARTVDDMALLSDALLTERTPMSVASSKFRFSFATSAALRRDWPAAYSFVPRVQERLALNGIEWGERDLSEVYENWTRLHYIILSYEASGNFSAIIEDKPSAIGPELQGLVKDGVAVGQSVYEKALANAEEQRYMLDFSLDENEILLCPASPGEAPYHHEGTGSPIFNSAWTLLHVPCLTFPVSRGMENMPLGLQLVARRGADRQVLAAAKFLKDILA